MVACASAPATRPALTAAQASEAGIAENYFASRPFRYERRPNAVREGLGDGRRLAHVYRSGRTAKPSRGAGEASGLMLPLLTPAFFCLLVVLPAFLAGLF